jgi:hypothetical protein
MSMMHAYKKQKCIINLVVAEYTLQFPHILEMKKIVLLFTCSQATAKHFSDFAPYPNNSPIVVMILLLS